MLVEGIKYSAREFYYVVLGGVTRGDVGVNLKLFRGSF